MYLFKQHKLAVILILIVSITLLVSCKNDTAEDTAESSTQPITETEPPETEEETTEPGVLPEGKMYSYLTGVPVDIEIGTKRPAAVVINNVKDALPSSGISQADIIYEVLVESKITRILALFEDLESVENIGSIRSARHNFYDIAADDMGVVVSYGWSRFAEERAGSEGLEIVNGMSVGGDLFYRASDKVSPHNVFAAGVSIEKAFEQKNIDRTLPEDYNGRLQFSTDQTINLEDGDAAIKVITPFSSKSAFEYNEATGLYEKEQFGTAHIDETNGQQLTFKNIIIQYAAHQSISNEDHQDVTLTGTGEGVYITNGKAISITWEKATDNDQTKYYDIYGSEIKLNPGKTYIGIMPTDFELELSE